MAYIFPSLVQPVQESQELQPAAIYGNDGPIKLRIATGGAGQTGVLKALAEAFIAFTTSSAEAGIQQPFRIAWLPTDTSLSFEAIATRSADLAITYHPYAAQIALHQGIALPPVYLWRDAFNLVGPASNTAKIPTDGQPSIFELFALLFQAAVSSADSPTPIKFLSRYDKSANNILESRIWTTIGQTPWSEPYSPWYHKFVAFPREALLEAAKLGEYTLVDRGTWVSMKDTPEMSSMMCFKEGAISWQEQPTSMEQGHILNGDALGNPAHALLSPYARDRELGEMFLKWMLWSRGGQEVIRNFKVNGIPLHGLSPYVQTFLGGQSSVSGNQPLNLADAADRSGILI